MTRKWPRAAESRHLHKQREQSYWFVLLPWWKTIWKAPGKADADIETGCWTAGSPGLRAKPARASWGRQPRMDAGAGFKTPWFPNPARVSWRTPAVKTWVAALGFKAKYEQNSADESAAKLPHQLPTSRQYIWFLQIGTSLAARSGGGAWNGARRIKNSRGFQVRPDGITICSAQQQAACGYADGADPGW